MQKSEAQHKQAQNQPTQRLGKGVSLESPQYDQIAQFEAMMETGPQATAQRKTMSMIHNSPRMAVQLKVSTAINNSPNVTMQRQQLDTLIGEMAQRKETDKLLQQKVTQRADAPAKSNNTGLPDTLKSGIESLSGMSMDNVKVHYNSSQPAQLNALAYAHGTDIHVAPGQEHHLPHEAWHVVQQAQGRVQPTMLMKEDVPVNDDKTLEHEADIMGARATSLDVVHGVESIQSAMGCTPAHKIHATFQMKNYSTEALQINSMVRGTWGIHPGNRIDGLKASLGASYGGKWALDYIAKAQKIPYVGADSDIAKRAAIAKAVKAGNCDDYGDLAYTLFKELGTGANVAIEQQPGHTYAVAWDDSDSLGDQTIIDPWVSRGHLRKDNAYYIQSGVNKIKTGKSDGTKADWHYGSVQYILAHFNNDFVSGKQNMEQQGSKILDQYNQGKKTPGIYE